MHELPLRPYHEASGATFRTEAGWSVPAGYGSVAEEVRSVREHAGMIDLSDRAKIELIGSERLPFLDGLVTADLKTLLPGTWGYALLLNEKSRVLGDLRAYVLPESLVLDLGAAQEDSVLRILEKARVSDDVEFRDLRPVGHIEVYGPASSDALREGLGVDVRGLVHDSFLTVPLDSRGRAYVSDIRSGPIVGYALWSAGSTPTREWEGLSRAGVRPVGRDAIEVLRIEAGSPYSARTWGKTRSPSRSLRNPRSASRKVATSGKRLLPAGRTSARSAGSSSASASTAMSSRPGGIAFRRTATRSAESRARRGHRRSVG